MVPSHSKPNDLRKYLVVYTYANFAQHSFRYSKCIWLHILASNNSEIMPPLIKVKKQLVGKVEFINLFIFFPDIELMLEKIKVAPGCANK